MGNDGGEKDSKSVREVSQPKLNWTVRFICRSCGDFWDYVDDELAISLDPLELPCKFDSGPVRKVAGVLVLTRIPKACPKCLNLKVVG